MANVIKQDIQNTAIRILEDWAMMMVDPTEPSKEVFDLEQPFLVATIRFRGPVNGTYKAVCQIGFARTLANNLLGTDTEIGETEMSDALKEMINVLSGNLLTTSYGEDEVFDLTTPEVNTADCSEVESLLTERPFSFSADCEPFLFSFALEV